MIKCPNCTAELQYSPGDKEVICKYCYSKFDPSEFIAEEKYAKENKNDYNEKGKSYTCTQCGATLMTFDETAVTFCSYCGSQAMIESQMKFVNNPEYIIPFKKTKEECIANYKKKVNRSLFVPRRMKSDIIVNQFRGIYMPYAVYNFSIHDKIHDSGRKYKMRLFNYKIYKRYSITADANVEYKGMTHDLLSNYSDKISNDIPFDFKEAKPFNSNYLIGYYADTKDVENRLYYNIAKELVQDDLKKRFSKIWKYKRYGCKNIYHTLDYEKNKIGMFPVYFLSVKDSKSNRINYAVVNGQTGKVSLDLPIDFAKYIVFSLILAIPIFFLVAKLPVIRPIYITIFAILSAIISIHIAIKQAERLYIHEKHLDDIGYKIKEKTNYQKKDISDIGAKIMYILFVTIGSYISLGQISFLIFPIIILISLIVIYYMHNEDKVPIIYQLKYTYKQLIAILIPIIVLIINPVKDIYYYGAAMLSILFVILAFYSLVCERNLIISKKLPQLEKRGGDENV